MSAKCEGCRKKEPTRITADDVELCDECYEACPVVESPESTQGWYDKRTQVVVERESLLGAISCAESYKYAPMVNSLAPMLRGWLPEGATKND